MKLITTAADLLQAQLFRDELQQLGIPVEVFNGLASSGLGDLAVSYPEIWVKRDTDEARAREFIMRFEQKLNINADASQAKLCLACDTENPGTFDFCWACAQALD